MNKDTQAAILRAAGRFIGKRLEALEPRFKALEARAVIPGPAGEKGAAGERGEPGPEGPAGADGKSVTLDEVMKALMPEICKALDAIPRPADGKDGAPGERGADGRSVTLDDVLPVLKSMQAEWALDFEKRAQSLFQKAVEAIPKPADGKDGKDGIGWDDMTVEHDGKRGVTLKWIKGETQHIAEIVIPCVIDAGFYKEGNTYEQGDGVTFGGSYWIAQKATSDKPEVGGESWRLAVRKGRDGKSADRVETRPVLQVS